MTASRLKRLALVVVPVALLVLVLAALDRRQPIPQVVVEAVVRQNLNAAITSNGKVEPIEPHPVRAQLATFIEKTKAVEGQAVNRGQLLLTLDAAAASAELARARGALVAAEEQLRAARAGGNAEEVAQLDSDMRKANAELARLRREREALTRLAEKQAATRAELEQNRLALDRAESEARLLQQKKEELQRRSKLDVQRAGLLAEQARKEIASLEEKVRSAEVRAPLDGTLYSLPVHAGDYVRVGDLLAEMADLRRVRIRAFVDEPELGLVERAQPVEISWDAAPNRIWPGVTEQIPKSVVSRGTRTVGEVLCSVANDSLELLPNINVNVRIQVRARANALVVPRGAVRGDGSMRYVFVVEGNRLRKREIKLGIASATMYEVLEGLLEGERIALPGDVELREGVEVRATEQRK